MPCYDPTPDLTHFETRKRLDEVTSMLCEILDAFEKNDVYSYRHRLPERIYNWHQEHKLCDEERTGDRK